MLIERMQNFIIKKNEEFDPISVNRRTEQQKRLNRIRLNRQDLIKTEGADRKLINTT